MLEALLVGLDPLVKLFPPLDARRAAQELVQVLVGQHQAEDGVRAEEQVLAYREPRLRMHPLRRLAHDRAAAAAPSAFPGRLRDRLVCVVIRHGLLSLFYR